MKLILHIGTEKTGTTAIQKYLKSKEKLADLNLWTSRSQGLGNHSYYAAYALDTKSRDVAMTMRNLSGDTAKHTAFREMIERSLIRDIKASKAPEFVITSEDLSRVSETHEIARLCELFSAHFDEVQIVLFVRRQDEVAMSRHGMFTRDGVNQRFSFAAIDDSTRHKFYDYGEVFTRWQKQFPDAQFTVVPYGKSSQNAGRDSVGLFLEAIGRSLDSSAKPLIANTSVSPARYRFFQIMRRRQQSKLSYAEALPLLEALPFSELDKVLPASASDVQGFLDWFSGSNLSLAAQIGNGQIFDEDVSMYSHKFDWDAFDHDIMSRATEEVCAKFITNWR